MAQTDIPQTETLRRGKQEKASKRNARSEGALGSVKKNTVIEKDSSVEEDLS